MSLEAVIAENTVALSRHTAAMEKLTALLESGAAQPAKVDPSVLQPANIAPEGAKKPAKAEEPGDTAAAEEHKAASGEPAELTYEEVAALVGKACLVSRAKVKAILADYKAANLSGVPKGKWPEVKGRLETLIAEGV